MSYETALDAARDALREAQAALHAEIRAYPTPVSGCDAQYNHMIGQRGAIAEALRALDTPHFVPTPRTLAPGAGVESR